MISRSSSARSLALIVAIGCAQPPADAQYHEFEVDSTVALLGGGQPELPPVVFAANRTGTAMAQFVVDTSGRALMETFRLDTTLHALVDDAIRRAVRKAVFRPAFLKDTPVKQLARMPFVFAPDATACARIGQSGVVGEWKAQEEYGIHSLHIRSDSAVTMTINETVLFGTVTTRGDSIYVDINGWREGARLIGVQVDDAMELTVTSPDVPPDGAVVFCRKV